MIEELEIRKKLAEFELGELSLLAFYDWLEEASWDMHRDSDPHVIELVGLIKLIFADYDMGLIDRVCIETKLISISHQVVVFESHAEGHSEVDTTALAFLSPTEASSSSLASVDLVLA